MSQFSSVSKWNEQKILFIFQDKRERIDQAVFEESVENLMIMAGDALSSGDRESILHDTDKILGEMKKLADLVKLQQRNYADLAVKMGFLQHSVYVERMKQRVSAGLSFIFPVYFMSELMFYFGLQNSISFISKNEKLAKWNYAKSFRWLIIQRVY